MAAALAAALGYTEPSLAAPAGEQTKKAEEVFVHTEGFVQDHTLSGLFSQCTEYFSAEDWEIRKAQFVMNYTVTQLKDEKLSDFTVSLNGEPFYSGRFQKAGGQMQTLKLDIPVRLVKDGINELKIESYIRTEDSLPCVDDVSKANWFHVSKDSAVNISYTPDRKSASIADVYSQLTGIYALENKKSAVIIPDAATDTAMTAAANILTGVSRNAKTDYQNLRLLTADEIFKKGGSRELDWGVYVAEWDFLSETMKNAVSQQAKKEMQNGSAVWSLIDHGGMKLLVLTGTDKELMLKGAGMFGNADYMSQMTDVQHIVTVEENPVMEKKEPLEYTALTEEGAYVNGAFRQTFSFTQAAYANKTLSPASQIYLKMRYSKNIDFDRSLMTVYVNDVPIGSHRLSEQYAEGDEAELFIPADMKVSGDFTIKVAFDLEIKDLWCTLRQGETPWAYVSPESMVKIVTADDVPLLFEHYPAPFLKTKSIDSVLIALPEKPSGEDLKAMQGICLTLGRFQEDNTGELTVKQGAVRKDCSGHNVIAIGTYQANPLIREQNSKMYFKFNENGTAILTNEKKRITEEAGEIMGTLQLLEHPSGEKNKGILIVTGPTPKAMSAAARCISDADELWKLTGDGSVVSGGELQNYQFKDTKDNRITAAKDLMKRDDVLRLLVTAIAVAAVLIFGLILILVKHIRGGKRKKEAVERKEETRNE